jgi:FkbM family methyltransferase
MLAILRAVAPPGARVLDLGGHVGTFSLAAAAAGHEVLAVEASPGNAALLRESFAAAARAPRLVHAAVGAEDGGDVAFGSDGPYGQVGAGEERVPLRSVDSILAECGFDGVAFVKMDVEGCEVAAVRGGAGLFGGPDAPPVVFESNGHSLRAFGESPASLKGVLASAGYRLHRIRGDDLIEEGPSDFQPATCVDYLAAKSPLPPVPGLRPARRPGPRDLAREVERASRSSSPQARAHLARSLASCDPAILALGPARRAARRLREDPELSVRLAAAEIPPR